MKNLAFALVAFLSLTCFVQAAEMETCNVEVWDDEIMYFDCTKGDLGKTLSQFLREHPNLDIVSVKPLTANALTNPFIHLYLGLFVKKK